MLDKTKLSRDYEKEPLGRWEDIPEQDLRYLYCDSGMNKLDICKYLPCCTAKLYRLVKKYNIHKKVQGVDPALLAKVDWSRLRRNYIEEPLKWREMPTKEELEYLYIELEFSRVDISRFLGRGDSERFAQALLTKYQIRLPKEIATRRAAETYKAKTGYSSSLADPAVHKKAQETCLKRYGATSWMKTDAAKKAQGVTLNTPEMIERAKLTRAKTNLSRYGVINPCTLQSTKERRRQTCLEKYNAESYPQSLVPQESLEILNTKEAVIQLFMEYPEYNTIKLGKLLGVSGETLRRRLQQFDLLFFIQQPTSSFERELKQLFPTVELRKDRTVLDGKEIDLYAPEFKIGLEFNGNYWHSDAQKSPSYHKNKSIVASSKGVFLFHIFEFEWMIPEQKQRLIQHIKRLFKLDNAQVIQASECELRQVSYTNSYMFLEQNSIQGHDSAHICYGLYYNNELVYLMTFAPASDLHPGTFTLSRYCHKFGVFVSGGAERVFSYFCTQHRPKAVVATSDIAKSKGTVFSALGFKHIHTQKQDFKWTDGNTTLKRSQAKKPNLIKLGMATEDDPRGEAEILRDNDYYRIYDCGKKVWKWVDNSTDMI